MSGYQSKKLGAVAKVRPTGNTVLRSTLFPVYQTSTTQRGKIGAPLQPYPDSNRKTQKMKQTIRQRIRNWLMNDPAEEVVADHRGSQLDRHDHGALTFSLYSANGGTVIELRDYSRDNHGYNMYVIPSNMDMGEELSKIITMEMLKR